MSGWGPSYERMGVKTPTNAAKTKHISKNRLLCFCIRTEFNEPTEAEGECHTSPNVNVTEVWARKERRCGHEPRGATIRRLHEKHQNFRRIYTTNYDLTSRAWGAPMNANAASSREIDYHVYYIHDLRILCMTTTKRPYWNKSVVQPNSLLFKNPPELLCSVSCA